MVSIVMPAWNEEEIIEACVREWHAEVVSRIPGAELIVVDDCSTDSTGRIVSTLGEQQFPSVRCIRPEVNGGHGRALRLGFDNATQPFVFQTDSDRQHVPSDFWKLWEIRDRTDFVLGIRRHRADGAVRIVITRAMRVLNLMIWGVWVRDANCPFKLMRREALEAVLAEIPRNCFIPMVLVSILSRKRKFRVVETEVEHFPRKGGTQSLKGTLKWARISLQCSLQLLSVRVASRGNRAAPAAQSAPR